MVCEKAFIHKCSPFMESLIFKAYFGGIRAIDQYKHASHGACCDTSMLGGPCAMYYDKGDHEPSPVPVKRWYVPVSSPV